MKDDIKVVAALPNHRLHVELEDGRVGVFDMRAHLSQPGLEALRDMNYFGQVRVLLGAPTWPGGEDISPASIAAALQSVAVV